MSGDPGSSLWEGRVRRVPVAAHRDARGVLRPLSFERLDFAPVRAFLVTAPSGSVRGGHGHRRGRQLLLRVSGEIELELAWSGREARWRLTEAEPAVLIHSPVWARQTYLGAPASLMVFSDVPWDPDDYIEEKAACR